MKSFGLGVLNTHTAKRRDNQYEYISSDKAALLSKLRMSSVPLCMKVPGIYYANVRSPPPAALN